MQQNLVLFIMLAAAFVFVYFKLLMGPIQIKNNDALTKLQQVENRLNEMKRRAVELPKLQAEMKLLQMEVAELEKKLPREKELPGLLRTFTKTAQRYSLRISNFNPMPVVSQANYNEVPFQVTLQGTYHSLAFFLSELGQQPRVLNAKNIVFSINPASKDNPSTVNVSFILVAFTFKG